MANQETDGNSSTHICQKLTLRSVYLVEIVKGNLRINTGN